MWRLLRQSFPNAHFRRQLPIRQFVADFASHRAKLVIEVDGGQHGDAVDAHRSRTLEDEGYRVLRFWNNEVLGNADGIYAVIAAALHDRHPHLASPIEGEG
jgi:very-short-patch-repair endonuclease